MKLLRDLICLRADGRSLFRGRRNAHDRRYAVTVPQPLPVRAASAAAVSTVAIARVTDSTSTGQLRLLSSC